MKRGGFSMSNVKVFSANKSPSLDRNEADAEKYPVYLPRTDVVETSGNVKIWAEMPGVDGASVDVVLEKNVLNIEGYPKEPSIPDGYMSRKSEYPVGRYRRSFTLSSEFDWNAIQAKMKNGVLCITLPRNKESAPRKIEVAVDNN